ncbi:hypothetical protein [Caenimonas sp. SL110]|uniref:hypothetical protein n=1 Tax=Caenimonas sp. SL110 TaxID=1450524 RepID=UPI0009E23DA0|nr:hypothetical protein [Caenimonas sp. SL110]
MADVPGEQHEPAQATQATPPTQAVDASARGFSFPYSVPLVLYPILAIGIAVGAARWWGWVFIIAAASAAVFFTREGLSSSQFEAIHAGDPTLNLLTWRINWLVLFALPAAALTAYALLKRLW